MHQGSRGVLWLFLPPTLMRWLLLPPLLSGATEAQRAGVDWEPCPRLPSQDEPGFEPSLAETRVQRRGVASSGSRRGKGQLEPRGLACSSREARAPLGSPISGSREIRGSNKFC